MGVNVLRPTQREWTSWSPAGVVAASMCCINEVGHAYRPPPVVTQSRRVVVGAPPGLAVRHLHGNRCSDWSDEPKVLDDVTRQLTLA